jgi:hypothetical protein
MRVCGRNATDLNSVIHYNNVSHVDKGDVNGCYRNSYGYARRGS